MRKTLWLYTVSAAVLWSSAVQAQTVAAGDGAAAAAASGDVEEVVVTGSRIARRDLSANSPIATVDREAIEGTGKVTVEATLNQMPQFVAASGAASSGPPGNGGQANLNLRGLGANRSLVLMDGQRMQPSNANGTIDINTVPDALIESIETITGGASAVYGSDAMAGVVNFRLKRNFQGLQLDAQYGRTDRGDGATQSVALTTGGNFNDDRGNAVLAISYANRDRVIAADRPEFQLPSPIIQYLPQGTAVMATNSPSAAAVNAVFARYGVAPGTVTPTMQLGFNPNGTLFSAFPVIRPIANYQPMGTLPTIRNYDGPLDSLIIERGNSLYMNTGAMYDLQIPLTRYNVFGKVRYDLTANLSAYAQANYVTYEARRGIAVAQSGFSGQNLTVPVTNPFIPADLSTLLASRPSPAAAFQVNKAFDEIGRRIENNTYDVFQIATGVEGKVGFKDWGWNLYGTYGRTQYLQEYTGSSSVSATQRLLNAADGGRSLCDGGYNIFGVNQLSQGCYELLSRVATNRTTLEQRVVEANLQGGLVDLPAGEVRFAVGAGYRYNSFAFRPDAQIIANDIFGYTAANAAGGSSDVYELYGEVLVPIVRDLPFVEEFSLDLAYRYSDYNPSGSVSAYNASFDWRVIPTLRFRGGYQRGVRAPALSELYAAPTSAAANIGVAVSNTGQPAFNGDPCDIQSAYRASGAASQVRALCVAQGVPAVDSYLYRGNQVPALTVGNPELSPEIADTLSAGAVWRPSFDSPWLAGLSASVDYYDIKITKAIGVIALADSISRCFNGDGTSNTTYDPANIYCRNLVRQPATGNLLNSRQPLLNLGFYQTRGVDMQGEWRLALPDVGFDRLGSVRLNVQSTWLKEFLVQDLEGGAVLDYSGTTGGGPATSVLPEWRTVTTATYSQGPFELALRWRYFGEVEDRSRAANPASQVPGVAAFSYFDLSGRWRVNDKVELRGGATNLTDEQPPIVGGTVGLTDRSTYDVLGRAFYVALRIRLD